MIGSPNNIADSVRHAGYLAYDNGIFSKHRGPFVDLDFHKLMGPIASIVPSNVRRLRSSEDPTSVNKYMEAFTHMLSITACGNVSTIALVASFLTVRQCKSGYDAINRDITRAMLHAEKCAKRPAGKYSWSPKLRETGLLTRYWHLQLREIEHGYCLVYLMYFSVSCLHQMYKKICDWRQDSENLPYNRYT
jgi:hypothetical protein